MSLLTHWGPQSHVTEIQLAGSTEPDGSVVLTLHSVLLVQVPSTKLQSFGEALRPVLEQICR